jgi:ketopantoate reductase
MMRIAVAGGGGLGYLLASAISQADNAYNVVVLSRTV